nr:YIP1 family protein [Sphingomonadaceae bacterium]
FGGSTADAVYGSSNGRIRLKLSDLGAAGGLVALGQAFNVQSSKQTATGYERVGNVDGRMTAEKFDTSDKSGSYSTLIGNRVMVEAEGNAPSIDALKGAVATIDLAKLDTLVKG